MPESPQRTTFIDGPWHQRTVLGRIADQPSQPGDLSPADQPGDNQIPIPALGGRYIRTRYKDHEEVYKWHLDDPPEAGAA